MFTQDETKLIANPTCFYSQKLNVKPRNGYSIQNVVYQGFLDTTISVSSQPYQNYLYSRMWLLYLSMSCNSCSFYCVGGTVVM